MNPLTEFELETLHERIKEIIEESYSTWQSCMFLDRKPNLVHEDETVERQYRIVSPFFGLNKNLSLRQTPLPTIFDILNRLQKAILFFRLLTSFGSTGTWLHQPRVLPMGCVISTSDLQSCLSIVLKEDCMDGVIVYCGDIRIYTKDESSYAFGS